MSTNNENSNDEYDLPWTTGIRITFVIEGFNSIQVAVDIKQIRVDTNKFINDVPGTRKRKLWKLKLVLQKCNDIDEELHS